MESLALLVGRGQGTSPTLLILYLLRILVAFITACLHIYETSLTNLELLYPAFYKLYLIRTKVKVEVSCALSMKDGIFP